MNLAVLRRVATWVGPEGLLLLVAVVFIRLDGLAAERAAAARMVPYIVLGAGVMLGWRFQRSRLLFSLLLLALADRALAAVAPIGQELRGRLVFQAVAFLLPLSLAALSFLAERGTLTRAGVLRLAAVGAQVALVVALDRYAREPTVTALEWVFFPERLLAWTEIGQPALLAFAVAFALMLLVAVTQAGPTARGFLWALVATFLALRTSRVGPETTLYFSTAALVLIVAMVEASYVMAYQDGLTALPSRRALGEALLRLAGRYAVAMVDVDHFKRLNDTYGHDVGDQVLRMIAAKLARAPGGGRAFRYGGEEFAVLFPGRGADEVVPDLDALRRDIADSVFTIRGRIRTRRKRTIPRLPSGRPRKRVTVTVSMGVAERAGRIDTPDAVIQAADQALYRAKEAGRNRVKL